MLNYLIFKKELTFRHCSELSMNDELLTYNTFKLIKFVS